MDTALDAAIRAVEASGGPKNRTTRHLARPVLVAIGECLIEGRTAEAEATLARLARWPDALREAFDAAVRDELAMACAEHVQSVDPRYLHHPDYDVAYTVEARQRLEARLLAAERLGIRPDEPTLAHVRRADALLGSRRSARESKS